MNIMVFSKYILFLFIIIIICGFCNEEISDVGGNFEIRNFLIYFFKMKKNVIK